MQWLQKQLLEACYAKVKFVGTDIPRAEPIAFHFTCKSLHLKWTMERGKEGIALQHFHISKRTQGRHAVGGAVAEKSLNKK